MNASTEQKNLATALAAFAKDVKNPACTANNPFFNSKYAPLHSILDEVRPVLAKHGLSVVQSTVSSDDGGGAGVVTRLVHASGEWLESDPLVLRQGKGTAQDAGSAVSYARRYSLCAMLGIASDPDDDGQAASSAPAAAPKPARRPAKQAKPTPSSKAQEWIDVFADLAATPSAPEFALRDGELRKADLTPEEKRDIAPAYRKAKEACSG